MRSANRIVASAVLTASIVLACSGDVNEPGETGQIAVQFALQGAAQAPLEAITVELAGPTNTSIDLVESGGFFEGTAEDLQVGTYTLTAIGQADGEVTYYGTRSGVNVTADQTTEASVPIVEFIPVLTSVDPDAPTKIMTFNVEFTAVEGATTYRVEWESGDTGGFVNTTSTSANVPVTVAGEIEFQVRAGNADVDPEDAEESEPLFATVEEDNAANDQANAVSFGNGIGTDITLTDFNIVPATEEDWIEVDVAGGERVTLRVRTESLPIPSALDPVITIYDVDGNVVDMNDDRDNDTVESELIHVPAGPGQLFIAVSSSGGESAGHYEMTLQIDNNEPVALVDLSPSSSAIVTDRTVLLTGTPQDASGATLFRPISWTSSDASVVTVDDDGLVSAVGPGRATITAESEGIASEAGVEVRAPVTPVDVSIDGVMAAGEWDNALQIHTGTGAGTLANATIFIRNDDDNLYLAFAIPDNTNLDTDVVNVRFDNDNNRALNVNDDIIAASRSGAVGDGHFDGTSYVNDSQIDVTAAASQSGDHVVFEMLHPLNSGDVNDIALSVGDLVGMCFAYFNDGSSSGGYRSGCVSVANEQRLYEVIQIVP